MIRTILTIALSITMISCNENSNETHPGAGGNTETQKKGKRNSSEMADIKGPVRFGKYGCTASKYSNGAYEYLPKGSFTLEENGTYTYNGFEEPSKGSFSVDEKGVILFRDGYFDGGEATPMEGEKYRYYVVFPKNPDNRWTAGIM